MTGHYYICTVHTFFWFRPLHDVIIAKASLVTIPCIPLVAMKESMFNLLTDLLYYS